MAKNLPIHSFGVTTASGMLAKLERELERLSSASGDSQNIVDHSINCAITAWHMVDWVWREKFHGDLVMQTRLTTMAGEKPPTSTWDGRSAHRDFKNALLKLCPDLKICEDIAVGAKHVFPEFCTPKVTESRVSARSTESFTFDVSRLGSGDILSDDECQVPFATQYIPKIEMADGTTRECINVFDGVVLFWKDFLLRLGTP